MEHNDKTLQFLKEFVNDDLNHFNNNLNKLIKDYERKTKRLDKIIKQSDKQQTKLISLNEELDQYKNHLEKKVQEEITKREEKEKMLLQQSKLAAMGEMMDAVAHQWKQPINIIKMQIDMIRYDFEDDLITNEYIQNLQNKIFFQIDHMTNTLNEFRSFFRPNKEVTEFDAKDMVQKVLLLVKDEFIKNRIDINLEVKQNFKLMGVENEFKHLILNIINNAKDAFNENDIKERNLTITILVENKTKKIQIEDNAGGIPNHVIKDIFKANVTTKEEGKGTGIGLYMSSQIAQKHHGDLTVQNLNGGARFIFQTNSYSADNLFVS